MNLMSNNFNILGIDPGTNTGISIINLNYEDLSINYIKTFTINLNNYIDESLPKIYKDADKLLALESILMDLLIEYNPKILAMENAFFNKKFPLSGLILSSFVGVITMTVRKFNKKLKIYKLQPKYVKSNIAKGDAFKDDMKLAVKNNEVLNKYINVEEESEHSIDATAIAYVLIKILNEYPYVLLDT